MEARERCEQWGDKEAMKLSVHLILKYSCMSWSLSAGMCWEGSGSSGMLGSPYIWSQEPTVTFQYFCKLVVKHGYFTIFYILLTSIVTVWRKYYVLVCFWTSLFPSPCSVILHFNLKSAVEYLHHRNGQTYKSWSLPYPESWLLDTYQHTTDRASHCSKASKGMGIMRFWVLLCLMLLWCFLC